MASSEEATLAVPVETDGDYIADEFDLVSRLKHWTNTRTTFLPVMLFAIQLSVVFACGARMEEHGKTLDSKEKEEYLLKKYFEIVDHEISHCLDEDGLEFFKVLKGAKGGKEVDGKQLQNKYDTIKSILKNKVMPLFPKDFHLMRSGTGLRQEFKRIQLELYRMRLIQSKKVSKEEAAKIEAVEKPFDFEFKSQYPEILMLAAKVHRTSPILVHNVGEATKKGTKKTTSRAQGRRDRQAEYDEERQKRIKLVHKDEVWKKRVEMASAKARSQQAQSTEYMANTVARIGKVDEIAKSLELLDKYGDASHLSEKMKAEKIGNLLSALPDPTTFADETKPRLELFDLTLSDSESESGNMND